MPDRSLRTSQMRTSMVSPHDIVQGQTYADRKCIILFKFKTLEKDTFLKIAKIDI